MILIILFCFQNEIKAPMLCFEELEKNNIVLTMENKFPLWFPYNDNYLVVDDFYERLVN